jgi:hypothetical protein
LTQRGVVRGAEEITAGGVFALQNTFARYPSHLAHWPTQSVLPRNSEELARSTRPVFDLETDITMRRATAEAVALLKRQG